MAISSEQLWNSVTTMGDEVHDIALKVVRIEEKLSNHLAHQDKKTNTKLAYLAIGMATFVGLMAIFI